ncbi:Monoacylglycerol lipase [Labeo rohita]|uniref:Monoacylglycerol lipase n=1 Tax=Labeo rohita TaxID=84645 RepID=A0ABQ8L819_LABRO|nr:Monoacylglycerol lipase [Labeo rohita]
MKKRNSGNRATDQNNVFAEFTRITCKNLQNEFFGEPDKHTPCLMKIFKSKTGTLGQTLAELLEQVQTRRNTNQASCQENEVTLRRTAVLRGIPVLFGDDPSQFFKDSDENNFEHIPVGFLTVHNEDSPHSPSSLPVDPVSSIIIEGVCLLFRLSYALHLDYPKCKFMQVMLDLGSKSLKPKLQTLKDQFFA